MESSFNMFQAKTERIKDLSQKYTDRILELERIFDKKTNIYIDFADPINQLLNDGKKVILFATARKVASELNELRKEGLLIFDIQKIRNFICWKKEIKLD